MAKPEKNETPESQGKTRGENGNYTGSVRVVDKGVISPEMMPEISQRLLNYMFPENAIKTTNSSSMKKEITGFNAQYIINALNEIIGPNCWREYGDMSCKVPDGKSAFIAIFKGNFEIGNWKNEIREVTITETDGTTRTTTENYTYFETLLKHSTYGGSRNLDEREALKGAKTNFLKKVLSYISLGWESYALELDEDFKNMAEPEDKTPKATTTPTKPAATPVNPSTPNTAPATPISEDQKKLIMTLWSKTGQDDTVRKESLVKFYNKDSIKDLSSTQASDFIGRITRKLEKIEAAAKQEPAPVTPAVTPAAAPVPAETGKLLQPTPIAPTTPKEVDKELKEMTGDSELDKILAENFSS